ACRGRALQLIRDLPVEFHCDKGSYSWRQDGEKAALAAAIALLGGVSKMKSLHFEARLVAKTLKRKKKNLGRGGEEEEDHTTQEAWGNH
ncbi:hypothetical protein INR49_005877, partial [Caranx melampygus]